MSYPAHDGDPSGHFVRHQALELAKRGEDVHVVAPRPSPSDAALYGSTAIGGDALFGWPGAIARARENPLRLVAIAPLARALRRATSPRLDRASPRSARAPRFDRVHLHWLVPTAWPLAPKFEDAHVEAIAHGADVRMLLAMPRAARERVVTALVERATKLRFVADALKEKLARSLGPRARVALEARAYVEPMAIDLDVQPPATPGAPYVVWVGRDIPSKRLDLAIEACARANRLLVVVGATRAPHPNVRFTGTLPRKEALGWIANADALLSTSSEEGAPTAVREARALKIPVIACPAGDIERWSQLDSGILLTNPDPTKLAQLLAHSPARSTPKPDPRHAPPAPQSEL